MAIFDVVYRFFSGWRFPVVMISSLTFIMLLMAVTLAIPDSGSASSAFARDFKVWCFGYDPSTGALEWAYVWMFLVQPWLMVALVAFIWIKPLKEIWGTARLRIAPYVVTTLVLVCGLAGAVVASVDPPPVNDTSFPGDRIRTGIPAPSFDLVNHEGRPVSLDSLAGQVVLVTGMYTRCGLSCPFILAQAKRVLATIDAADMDGLTTLAITLDPKRDTMEDLNRMVEIQGFSAPAFQALNGDPVVVNKTLDRFGFSRSIDEETGEIDHANLFILIDRNRKIAYRFSLGEIQEAWMIEAIKSLIAEPA
jgi:protein SCO1/2